MKSVKNALLFAAKVTLSGFLIIVPIYLAVLLLLKAAGEIAKVLLPITLLLPEFIPAEKLFSVLIVLALCFSIGAAVRTPAGRRVREEIETRFLERIPGYSLFRSLTRQVAGDAAEKVWKPALAEIEEALVPAFIIEEFEDGRYTVFVPSVPTPLAGALYILERKRVHPVDVPFTQALQVVSRWGSGAMGLELAMERSSKRDSAVLSH
jgi:uncharacterized membrane protein